MVFCQAMLLLHISSFLVLDGPLSAGISWVWTTGGGGAISTSGAGFGNAKPSREAKADENNNVLGVPDDGWISGPKRNNYTGITVVWYFFKTLYHN